MTLFHALDKLQAVDTSSEERLSVCHLAVKQTNLTAFYEIRMIAISHKIACC